MMQLTLAHIGSQKSGKSPAAGLKGQYDALTRLYLDRASPTFPCQDLAFATEAALLEWLARPGKAARTSVFPVLLDSRGLQWTSEELAAWLGSRRDGGIQHVAFAIGPADGWSPAAIQMAEGKLGKAGQGKAGLLLSFGPITMAHSLARLVLAEQLYRACTILTGHPYHSGH